eukprot:865136-Prymnesium_polylepis.1
MARRSLRDSGRSVTKRRSRSARRLARPAQTAGRSLCRLRNCCPAGFQGRKRERWSSSSVSRRWTEGSTEDSVAYLVPSSLV